MSKKLKLVGVTSYVNPLTENIIIKKGEVILVSDKAASVMMTAKRVNAEGEDTFYWLEAAEDTAALYDFSENVLQGTTAKTAAATKNEETARSAIAAAPATRTRAVGKSGQRATAA